MAVPEELREACQALPDAPGVYIYRDAAGTEIYVGKAKSLRKRVRQYFDRRRTAADPKTAELVREIRTVEHIECASEVEAYLLENRLIKDFQPKYNIWAKSDVSFPYVEITWDESFPRVRQTRDRSRKGSKFHGPFISASWLRTALVNLQRAFPFRTCSKNIREDDPRNRFNRPCLEYHLGRCRAPCAGLQTADAYRADLRRLVRFLSGHTKETRRELEREMKAAAAGRHYEEAAELRDALFALDALSRRGGQGTESAGIEPGVLHMDPREGVRQLQKCLALPAPPRRIEGIDVAHLGGGETVGALVSFYDGLPARGEYRRYRIRTAEAGDDFAAVAEIVARRCRRLAEEGRPAPNLLLIDGGLGQLRAGEKAVAATWRPAQTGGETPEKDSRPPYLLGLSKKEELVHTGRHPEGLRLPRRSPALRLLQFVRDEAHRFARHYHHILRRKRVLEEDD